MKYLLCYILLLKTMEQLIWNSRWRKLTPADPRDVVSNDTRTDKSLSLVQSGVLLITKTGNIMFAVPQWASRSIWHGYVYVKSEQFKIHVS